MSLKPFCLWMLLVLLAQPACTQARLEQKTLTGVAVKIIDGDTFDLLTDDDHRTYRIRLHGIDCPERGQDFYRVAKEALGDFCSNRPLRVVIRDKDRYQRIVGDVYASGDRWVNLQLVAGGYAWHYTRYDQDARLEKAQQRARQQRLGLWSQPSATPPWEWRKARRTPKAMQ